MTPMVKTVLSNTEEAVTAYLAVFSIAIAIGMFALLYWLVSLIDRI